MFEETDSAVLNNGCVPWKITYKSFKTYPCKNPTVITEINLIV
jgi:hypothetical protein